MKSSRAASIDPPSGSSIVWPGAAGNGDPAESPGHACSGTARYETKPIQHSPHLTCQELDLPFTCLGKENYLASNKKSAVPHFQRRRGNRAVLKGGSQSRPRMRNLKAAVAVFVAHYHYCKIHSAIDVTPAMESGWALRRRAVLQQGRRRPPEEPARSGLCRRPRRSPRS